MLNLLARGSNIRWREVLTSCLPSVGFHPTAGKTRMMQVTRFEPRASKSLCLNGRIQV
jgi:hypothetical protein